MLALTHKRTRGCQRPFSPEQLAATTLQLAITAASYALFGVYAAAPWLAIPLAIYSVAVAGVLLCWGYCVTADPALPGGIPCKRMAKTQAQTRYCRLCAKSIPGLDHHCSWLNTCVGTRTYVFFVGLAAFGLLQHLLEVVLAICTAAAWRLQSAPLAGPVVFSVIVALAGVAGSAAFGSLFFFHLFLLRRGTGTFDWMVEASLRAAHAEEEAAARAQADAAATAALAPAAQTVTVLGAASVPGSAPPALLPPAPDATITVPPSAGGAAPLATQQPPATDAAVLEPTSVRVSVAPQPLDAEALAEAEAGRRARDANRARLLATGPGAVSAETGMFHSLPPVALPVAAGSLPSVLQPPCAALADAAPAVSSATNTAATPSAAESSSPSPPAPSLEQGGNVPPVPATGSKKWLGIMHQQQQGASAAADQGVGATAEVAPPAEAKGRPGGFVADPRPFDSAYFEEKRGANA